MVRIQNEVDGCVVEVVVADAKKRITVELDGFGEEDVMAESAAEASQRLDVLIEERETEIKRLRGVRSALPNLVEVADRAYRVVKGEPPEPTP